LGDIGLIAILFEGDEMFSFNLAELVVMLGLSTGGVMSARSVDAIGTSSEAVARSDDNPVNPTMADVDASPAAVLGQMHLTNIKEITMGKQARKKGRSKEVKELGSALVRDHTAADQKVLALAKREQVDVTATGETIDDVDVPPGTGFDVAFAEKIVQDHKTVIAYIDKVLAVSDDDALNTLVESLVPVLESHRNMAQQILDGRPRKEGR
jgi:putative membrane protein